MSPVSSVCFYRHRRYKKNMTFFHFNQPWPWTLDRPAVNEPIAMADVVDPHVKDKVNPQMEPTPGCHAHCVDTNTYI